MRKIDTPSFADFMDNDLYHGDCCEGPSLSHGGAHEIIRFCPAIYHHDSPYNTARAVAEVPERKFNLGQAAHTAMLEPEEWDRRVVLVQGHTADGAKSKGYTTKDAKRQRDEAYARSQIPLLADEFETVMQMRRALATELGDDIFTGGIAERSFFWRDPQFGVWLKCRPDYLSPDSEVVYHYKTTGRGAALDDLQKTNYEMAWFSTVPWYEDGIQIVTGKRPQRSLFIVQETEPPYLVSVGEIMQRAVEWGRKANRKAISIFADCVKTGAWPGYHQPDAVVAIDLPGWAQYRFAEADETGAFDVVAR